MMLSSRAAAAARRAGRCRRALAGAALLLLHCSLPTVASELVVVEGLEDPELANVLAFLGYEGQSCASPAWRLEGLFQRGPARIREALEVFGYFEPKIYANLDRDADCLRALYRVEPGARVRYGAVQVTVEGAAADAAHWRKLLSDSPLLVGAPLDQGQYERYKQRFANVARRFGYFDGEFVASEIRVYPERRSAEVTLSYSPGERYHYGEVVFEQSAIDEELVQRFVEFESGQPYSADDVSALYDAILLTGYFTLADIRTEPRSGDAPVVDVYVSATPSKASTYTAGVGYGTDTGPQVRLGYSNRRRNRAGHQWNVSGSASQVIKQAGATYRLPLDQPTAEWLSFEAGYRDEDAETLTSQQAKFGVQRLQRRGEAWLETQFIDVVNEDFEVANEPGNLFYIAPGISWNRVQSTPVARPVDGYRLSLQLSGAAEALASDLSFLQTIASAKTILPLPAGARLLARVELGATLVDDLQELPASLRFFAGGDFSVRGYDYKTLGPRDAAGEVLGGDNLLTASLEVDRLVSPNWALAAFVDAGNAFDSYADIDLQFGVGGGVRWFSPVGPIRVDLAFPLSAQTEDDFRLHISLSPDL